MKHPALKMSKVREQVWIKEASAEDYYAMIDLLKALYAKKIRNEQLAAGKYNEPYYPSVLMTDYANRKVEVGNEKPTW